MIKINKLLLLLLLLFLFYYKLCLGYKVVHVIPDDV